MLKQKVVRLAAQLISYINPLPSGMINFKEHENLIGAAPYSAVSLLYLFAPISGMIYFSLSGFYGENI